MKDRKELLSEILIRVQKNYTRMVEIERLTKELGDTLSRDDRESVRLLLKMRGEEMNRAGQTKLEIQMILRALNEEDQAEVKGLLAGEGHPNPEDYEAGKIVEISRQLTQVLERTIAVDRRISSKLAGKDSYYSSL